MPTVQSAQADFALSSGEFIHSLLEAGGTLLTAS
jgi:hypothetical protein